VNFRAVKRDGMRANLLAGLVSSVWSAGVGIAVVPLYLKYLGLEAYGLIGIFATAQSLFSLLDLGLAPAMNREVARSMAEDNLRPARELLHTLSLVYWTTGIAIALLAVLAAPLVAQHWLQFKHLSASTVTNALMLMGCVVACRWPIGLYLGTIIGAQRVTVSSGITIVMSTASNLGAVAILAWVSQRIEAFFLWQAVVGIVYALAMRIGAWNAIGRESAVAFSVPALTRIWRFSAGISAIAVSALILTQIDKVVMSHMLTLSEFGQYSLATVVVSGLYLFINPTFNVIFPKFTALVVSGDAVRLADLYRWGTRLFTIALFPLFMLLAVFAQDLVRVWTGNAGLAANVATVIALLATGAALHGVMYFSYALQLAHGTTRLPLTINLVLVALAAPLMTALAWRYGIKGGAAAVLLLYLSYLLIGTWLTHRLLLKSIGVAWLCRDVGAPFAVVLIVGTLGHVVLAGANCTDLQKVGLALAMLLGAWAFSIGVAPRSTLPRLIRLLHVPTRN
jgi:O-antigen/teichoic acid export membrane protein